MTRRTSAVVPATSFLACVVACALWARSDGDVESVAWGSRTPHDDGSSLVTTREVRAFSVSERVGFDWFWSEGVPFPQLNTGVPATPPPPGPTSGWRWFRNAGTPWPWHWVPNRYVSSSGSTVEFTWAGFSFNRISRTRTNPRTRSASEGWGVTVPWAFVAAVMAGPPVRRAARHLRRRRALASMTVVCSDCGYDLRVTPGRCPECGAVPAAADRAGGR